jgi:hypothetical protein
MNGITYAEIHQHGSDIIVISGPYNKWQEHISRHLQHLHDLFVGENAWQSWNTRANFLVSLMSNCTHLENTNFFRAILNELRLYEVMNTAVFS